MINTWDKLYALNKHKRIMKDGSIDHLKVFKRPLMYRISQLRHAG